jgi:hypothetical protein
VADNVRRHLGEIVMSSYITIAHSETAHSTPFLEALDPGMIGGVMLARIEAFTGIMPTGLAFPNDLLLWQSQKTVQSWSHAQARSCSFGRI